MTGIDSCLSPGGIVRQRPAARPKLEFDSPELAVEDADFFRQPRIVIESQNLGLDPPQAGQAQIGQRPFSHCTCFGVAGVPSRKTMIPISLM